MNTSKQIFEKEKRVEKANDEIVSLQSSTNFGYSFNAYTDDIREKVKYFGEISKDHIHDECGCQSFMHGNSENYQRDNPLPFQCKHIIAAHSMMEGYW